MTMGTAVRTWMAEVTTVALFVETTKNLTFADANARQAKNNGAHILHVYYTHTENITMFSQENYAPPPNPPFGSGDRVQTVFIVWWPWN